VGQHSDPSFEEFFAATYGRLVGLLFAFLHDQAQAEDAVQDAFSSAALADPPQLSRPRGLGPQGRLPPRDRPPPRNARRLRALLRFGPPPPLPPVGAEHVDLVRALRKLPVAQREVLVLHHVAELAVRRRLRRKVQGGMLVVPVGLLLAGVGVRLGSEAIHRRGVGPAPVVAPPAGPPAAVAPKTFVGQVGNGSARRTVIIDAGTGRIVRQVPGSKRQSELPVDAVVSPDLRSMYVDTTGPFPSAPCDEAWTQVDLATGATHPAFGGLKGVGQFSLSADGRSLAFVHLTRARVGTSGPTCDTEVVVRELASGEQRVWTIPSGMSVDGLQLSPDATQLAYLLRRDSAGLQPSLHVLPLTGTTSVTQGRDLPTTGDCPMSDPRFVVPAADCWPLEGAAARPDPLRTSWSSLTLGPAGWCPACRWACRARSSASTWTGPGSTSSSPPPASPTTSGRPPSGCCATAIRGACRSPATAGRPTGAARPAA
jgi:RNA polymerase sigma-70 factor (ECF subfamily)